MSNDGFKRHYALGDSNPSLVTCETCGAEVAKQRPMVGEQPPEVVDIGKPDKELLNSIEALREALVQELRDLKREVRQKGRRAV